MHGPKPRGHWSQHSGRSGWGLTVGHRYRVKLAFTDYDRDVHPIGATWTFVGYGYLPYDDGLSLFVLIGDEEWHSACKRDLRSRARSRRI